MDNFHNMSLSSFMTSLKCNTKYKSHIGKNLSVYGPPITNSPEGPTISPKVLVGHLRPKSIEDGPIKQTAWRLHRSFQAIFPSSVVRSTALIVESTPVSCVSEWVEESWDIKTRPWMRDYSPWNVREIYAPWSITMPKLCILFLEPKKRLHGKNRPNFLFFLVLLFV